MGQQSGSIQSSLKPTNQIRPSQVSRLSLLRQLAWGGVFVFLGLHLVTIWLVGQGPESYARFGPDYSRPLFRLFHLGLFFCLLICTLEGLRTLILDLRPSLWRFERQSVLISAVIFFILFIPSAILIGLDTFVPY